MTARVAFAHRDFRLAMTAKALSVTGGQMQSVAIGWQVYELTNDPLDLGFVGLVQFAPALFLALLAGHAADRYDRRKILLAYHAGMVASGLALFLVARMPAGAGEKIAAIYVISALLGVLRTFAGPANSALLPQLVPLDVFPAAVAWSSSTWQLAAILGPALGGVVYAIGSAPLVYATAATCACGALFAVTGMAPRPPLSARGMSFETLVAGLRYVFRNKMVLGSISLDLFAVLFGGAVALLPIYARDILHVGPHGLGVLRSAPAFGAATMAIGLAYRPITRRLGATMFLSVAVFGGATIVFGLSRSFALSLVALFVIGASDMISVVIRQLLVQLATPDEMRGRVSAVNLVFVGASNELGEFESGVTARLFGVVRAVVLGGACTCLVVVTWAAAFASLRRLDRAPHAAPSS